MNFLQINLDVENPLFIDNALKQTSGQWGSILILRGSPHGAIIFE